jgi:hypothetical protein
MRGWLWGSWLVLHGSTGCFVALDAPPSKSDASADVQDGSPDVRDADASDAPRDVIEASLNSGCDGGGVSLAQSTYTSTRTDLSNSVVTPPLPLSAGDYVLVGVNYDGAPDGGCGRVQMITDSLSDTYARLIAPDTHGAALTLETWGARAIASGPSNQATVVFAQACTSKNVKVVEYSGVGPSSSFTTASGHGGGDGGRAPSLTLTTIAPGLAFAHTADSRKATGAGAGWSEILYDLWDTLAEDRDVGSAGKVNVTYEAESDDVWVIQAVGLGCR